MIMLVVQLLCMHYLMSKDYNMVTTVACNKFGLEVGDCEVELLHPKYSLLVFLVDITNLDLDEVKEDNMQVDQTASADNLMVLLTLFRQAEVYFPGERVNYSFAPLKILSPGTSYTVSERRRSNPYLVS